MHADTCRCVMHVCVCVSQRTQMRRAWAVSPSSSACSSPCWVCFCWWWWDSCCTDTGAKADGNASTDPFSSQPFLSECFCTLWMMWSTEVLNVWTSEHSTHCQVPASVEIRHDNESIIDLNSPSILSFCCLHSHYRRHIYSYLFIVQSMYHLVFGQNYLSQFKWEI